MEGSIRDGGEHQGYGWVSASSSSGREHRESRKEQEKEGLGMFKENNVDTALDLKRELKEFDKSGDRSVLIKALRDQFLITRYDAAMLIEKSMSAALQILIGRMSEMSDNMLIKTIETLSKIGAVDMTWTGSGDVKRCGPTGGSAGPARVTPLRPLQTRSGVTLKDGIQQTFTGVLTSDLG
jgi:hypothetical protein